MERVFAGVLVVEDNLDDTVVLQDERVGVCSIDTRIGSEFSCGKGRIERGNLGCDIGDATEESVVLCEC